MSRKPARQTAGKSARLPAAPAPYDLAALRARLGFVRQDQMAARMGISARTYFTLESEPERIDAHYRALADRVSLEVAVERRDPSLATPAAAQLAREFATLEDHED